MKLCLHFTKMRSPFILTRFFLQVDFFTEDLEQFNRKINTPQMLANEKQMKEDLELMKQLRDSAIRKKLESQAK